jgi:isopentenyldiphosphate isomerase
MINQNELLFVVDENNTPLPPKPRHQVHSSGDWHRTSHVWIKNNQQQLLCQKRSLQKDKNPGIWEAYFGGHLHPQQEYLDGAIQEIQEELNLTFTREELNFFKVSQSFKNNEFQAIYYTIWNGDSKQIQFEKEEIDTITWLDIATIEKLCTHTPADWSFPNYTLDILPLLKSAAKSP